MGWGRLDDLFYDHPKHIVAGVLADGLWARSIAYSSRHLTDGFVPDGWVSSQVAAIPPKVLELLREEGQEPVDRLLKSRLWEPVEDGFKVHDYLDLNPSREDVFDRRRADSRRKRGGSRTESDRSPIGSSRERVRGRAPRPDPNPTSEADASDTKDHSSPSPVIANEEQNALRVKRGAAARNEAPEILRLCNVLADLVAEDGSKRPTVNKRWLDACRLMLDSDGRSEAEVEGAINWSQAHHFWRSNILCMSTLRKRFDQLRKQATDEKRPKSKAERVEARIQHLRAVADGAAA